MFKKVLSLILACAICTGALVGCGNKDISSQNDGEKSQEAQAEVITIRDMADREVIIPRDVQKVGTFGSIGVLNAFVECIGGGDKICNDMSPNFKKNDRWKYQYKFVPALSEKPQFENANREIIIENVIEVNPDVCLVMNKAQLEELEAKGQTVVYLAWQNVDDVKECIDILGKILNEEENAEKYIKYFDDTVKRCQDISSKIPENEKKKVLYGDVITYKQPHIIAEWWIKQAGGISVTDNGRTENTFTYSLEDLLSWNPEVIFLSTKATIEEIKAEPRMANIPAVVNGQVYEVPTVAHVWGNRTVEQPLTIMWAMNKMYPEIMTEEMLRKEIFDFYDTFYGYQMTDDEITEIIK